MIAIHGNMSQAGRQNAFESFVEHERAVLFSTDLASRGLDFPDVSWIVQLDCAEDIDTYIHRVGRTARYKSTGNSIAIFSPYESDFMLRALESKKIPVKEMQYLFCIVCVLNIHFFKLNSLHSICLLWTISAIKIMKKN